ncbi:hypothetical protein LMG27177_02316 [Paraburkholderia fynbosensis]|uniref:Uncharacterized protein n=1 Tax=Paraburkholderia fynbosensis TaxID=1200993 RepID=A0A6J5G188_9BURK|nr:hypothetical protein LMG27177_02316 [Paraburkholderia fynbosensis]
MSKLSLAYLEEYAKILTSKQIFHYFSAAPPKP